MQVLFEIIVGEMIVSIHIYIYVYIYIYREREIERERERERRSTYNKMLHNIIAREASDLAIPASLHDIMS